MKKTLPIRIDPQLHDRLMNFVYWTPGISANCLVVDFIEKFVDKVEKDNGGQYQPRGTKCSENAVNVMRKQ